MYLYLLTLWVSQTSFPLCHVLDFKCLTFKINVTSCAIYYVYTPALKPYDLLVHLYLFLRSLCWTKYTLSVGEPWTFLKLPLSIFLYQQCIKCIILLFITWELSPKSVANELANEKYISTVLFPKVMHRLCWFLLLLNIPNWCTDIIK